MTKHLTLDIGSSNGTTEIAVTGTLFRLARLRHEWCEFLPDPIASVDQMRQGRPVADVFTFVREIDDQPLACAYRRVSAGLAVLPVTTFQQWWDGIGFKTRNKIRKAEKSGVQLREAPLDDAFATAVESIYQETPVRQGRRFAHYGQSAAAIKEELASFLDRSILVGAYWNNELIGFMKLFHGANVLRTIHIIAKVSHRDKCAMDALISRGVELCDQKGMHHFHYGSWTDGGIGVFRTKHGFTRLEVPRYYVPLTLRGHLMLKLNLHRPLRERLPAGWVGTMTKLRNRLNSVRFGSTRKDAQD